MCMLKEIYKISLGFSIFTDDKKLHNLININEVIYIRIIIFIQS